MLQANEVRIGNWLYSPLHTKKMQVAEVSKDFLIFDDEMKLQVWFNEYETEGIPLTPEILKEYGYQMLPGSSDWFYFRTSLFELSYAIAQQSISIVTGHNQVVLKTHIKFLHQFQNLHLDIVGQELQLKKSLMV
jgi:hypothetical protein